MEKNGYKSIGSPQTLETLRREENPKYRFYWAKTGLRIKKRTRSEFAVRMNGRPSWVRTYCIYAL